MTTNASVCPGTQRAATFVVGTGRCGSTLLSEMLAEHADVLSLSEVFTSIGADRAFARHAMDGRELWELLTVPSPDAVEFLRAHSIPELRCEMPALRAAWPDGIPPLLLVALPSISREPVELLAELERVVVDFPRAASATQYQKTFEWLCDRLRKRVWIERSGGSLQFVEQLVASWPNARFVHLWREGPECAVSMAEHPYFREALGRLKGGASWASGGRLPPAAFGSYWSAAMIRGLRTFETIDPARVLHVSFQALTAAPVDVLRRIARFIGVDPYPSWLDQAGSRVRPRPVRVETLDAPVRAALERACLPGKRALRAAELSVQ